MNFELKYALLTLDSHTPNFFMAEALAKGDLTARRSAVEALQDLSDDVASSKQLRALLKLY
jgi:hypothetical protein